MTIAEKEEILTKAKIFFKKNIIEKHIKNTEKLSSLKDFNINPFTLRYVSSFAFGDAEPHNLAKALIYPRVLGTSISTTFGNQMQQFCNQVLSSLASTTSGIDIEFIDSIDNRHKFCQIKAGPTTINNDDVVTICNHFKDLRNLARQNGRALTDGDCIVGVLYGKNSDLSNAYNQIKAEYPVYAGEEFWHRLTGDKNFYFDLIAAFTSVVEEMSASKILNEAIEKLTEDIINQG